MDTGDTFCAGTKHSVLNVVPTDIGGPPMITFFATPKPFMGHIAVIQRNAITSWTLLRPRPEIVLVGDDQGTAEIAADLGLCHIPVVRRNEDGTPLLDDIFAKAEAQSSHDLLCYINADILLLGDFMKAVKEIAGWRRNFLMIGRRTDVHIVSSFNFASPDWETDMRQRAAREGVLDTPSGIDYFVFSRGLYGGIPPFALGRAWWDNWAVWRARALKVPVVDATAHVLVIHQHHDYAHHPQGFVGAYRGEERRRNHELAGPRGFATVVDATHKLTAEGLKRTFFWRLVPVRRTLSLLMWLLDVSRPVRHTLGVRRANGAKLTAKAGSTGDQLRQVRQ